MSVNVRGVFLCAKYAIPAMKANGGGVIVNTASDGCLDRHRQSRRLLRL